MTWTTSPQTLCQTIAGQLAAINVAIDEVRTDIALGAAFLPLAAAHAVQTWSLGTDRLPCLHVYADGDVDIEGQIYTCQDLVIPLTLELRYQTHDHEMAEIYGHAYARAMIGHLQLQWHLQAYPGVWLLEAERGGVELEDAENMIYLSVVEAEARLRVARRTA